MIIKNGNEIGNISIFSQAYRQFYVPGLENAKNTLLYSFTCFLCYVGELDGFERNEKHCLWLFASYYIWKYQV